MLTFEALSLVAFALSITLLGYSAYSDIKTREVSNRVWLIYLPTASIILCLRLFLNPQLLVTSLASIGVMASLSFLMFYVGLFGGADCKAFICLSIALPTHPFQFQSLLGSINPIFPLTVLYTTYFLSLSTILYIVTKNLDWKYRRHNDFFKDLEEPSLSKRAIALLTGYKTNFETLREKVYLYPMEEISRDDAGLHRRLRIFTSAEADKNELVRNLGEYLTGTDREHVWVTPGVPLLLFASTALILNAFVGDVLLWITFRVASIIF